MASKKEHPIHRVFVYGTLRPKGKKATHMLMWHALWDMGKFPAAVSTGKINDVVYGNIITVTDSQLKGLDYYEGIDSGLYTRQELMVYTKDEKQQDGVAFVYVAGNVMPELIESGDWLTHINQR